MNQSNQLLVSVVIPCYNHERFVQDSIQSVIDQTYQNIELIIIDDGSKDGSVKKIQQMIPTCQERFIRFEFRHRPNKGLSATLNEALEWCEGEFFSPLASDDRYLRNKVLSQVEKISEFDEVIALSSNISYIDETDNFIRNTNKLERIYYFEDIFFAKYFLPASSILIKTKVLNDVNGYDETRKIEDWDMWLKLAQKGSILFMEEVLSFYRLHETNSSKNIKLMNNERLEIISKYSSHTLFKKALCNVSFINFKQSRFENKKYFIISGCLYLKNLIKYFLSIGFKL